MVQRGGPKEGKGYEELARARRRKGISQKSMAEALGYASRQSYSMKERGMRRFSVEEALVVAHALQSDVESVFGGSSEQNEDF